MGISSSKATVATEPLTTREVAPETLSSAPAARASLAAAPLILLSIAHFSVDLYSSFIGTAQPLLVERYALSLTQAGILGGVFMFASSVLQLGFGVLSDRVHSRMFTVLSPMAAGLFLASLFHATGYFSLLLLVFLGGVGVAAFHPLSTKEASAAGGPRKGLAVSVFITSGVFGLSMGPAYFSTIVEWIGLDSLIWSALPALILSILLFWKLPQPSEAGSGRPRGVDYAVLRKHWKPLSVHYSLVVLRSIVQVGLVQFLALYFYNERGFTFQQSSFGLTVFLVSAAVGSLLGGGLADRIGNRKVVLLSMSASVPFLALFLGSSGWVSLVSLFIGGVILLLTVPVIVVMAQDLVPSQAATVSGMMMGFAWGMAGMVFVPLIGWFGDRVGLEPAFWALALLPLAGFVLAFKLPRSEES